MKQINKFFIVGLFSTGVDYLLYSYLVFIDVNYILAICAGYFFGFLFNFYVSRKYVFDKIKIEKLHHEFLIVLVISIFAVGLNIAIVFICKNYLSFNYYIGRIFAIGIVFFFNYFARKGFIYE